MSRLSGHKWTAAEWERIFALLAAFDAKQEAS